MDEEMARIRKELDEEAYAHGKTMLTHEAELVARNDYRIRALWEHLRKALEEKQTAEERAEQAERELETARYWKAKWQVCSDAIDKRNDQLTDAKAEITKLREALEE
jgi:hypothetical protein